MSSAPRCIEAFFFNKLINSALFGEPKEGLLDSLKERVQVATEQQCDRAAEIIIRERKSGTFPSFPVCLDALERGATAAAYQTGASLEVSSAEGVTRENFHAKCQDYAKASGRRPFLLKREKTVLWLEWRQYFAALGMKRSVELMDDPSRTEWTTPSEVPSHFDPRWKTPVVLEEARRDQISYEERQQVSRMFSKLEDKFAGKRTQRKKLTQDELADEVEQLREDYLKTPIKVSEAALRSIGMTPAKITQENAA